MSTSNTLYPIFLKLNQLETLIVGGGEVGLEKITYILKSSPDARVTMVSPYFKQEIRELTREHEAVKLISRAFIPEDLIGKNLAILATGNEELNYLIRTEAKARNVLTNVADTPGLCDFYLGSIVTKGDLKIGISTNGKSPTFAKRFREVLEDVLPDDIPKVLNNLRKFRNTLKGDFNDKVKKLNELTAGLVGEAPESKENDLIEQE